jgi:hypothetical protein
MNPWPIAPLGTNDLDFATVNYDFTGLTAGDLSPTAGMLDAIDSAAADFSVSLADQTTLIDSMAGDLDDLGKVVDEMAGDDFEQIAADLAGIASTGDSLLSSFAGLF